MVDKDLNELCGIFKTAKSDIKKYAGHGHVLAVQNMPNFKKQGKSKGKERAKDSISKPKPKPKDGPKPDTECYYCHESGHWKRNCSKYLASLKKSGSKTSSSGTLVVNVIGIFLADSIINSWVFGTGSVAHICKSMQGLVRSRCVRQGEVDLRVGNNARVAALSVGV